jgi:hypothetical protein
MLGIFNNVCVCKYVFLITLMLVNIIVFNVNMVVNSCNVLYICEMTFMSTVKMQNWPSSAFFHIVMLSIEEYLSMPTIHKTIAISLS